MDHAALKAKLCEIGARAYARELVDGTGGNFSCRLDDGLILCTPTLTCKGRMAPDDLCIVDPDGRPVSAPRPVSSEVQLHLALYKANPDTGAVVHTHPPYATTLAVLGEHLPTGILPEGDVFLGAVPLVPYRTPGTPALGAALAPLARSHVAALLQNHGAVTWGPDVETAYVLTETLEAVSRVYCQARVLGQLNLIPPERQEELAALRERFRAGLKRP